MRQYLITDINDLKDQVKVSFTEKGFNDFKPYIWHAQKEYLQPTLGAELLQELLDHADPTSEDSGSGSGSSSGSSSGSGATTTNLAALLDVVKPALAHLMLYECMPILEVNISPQGIHQYESEKLTAIFSSQRQRLEATMLRIGLNELEDVLEYLESNRTSFVSWMASDAFTVAEGHYIRTAKEFTTYWTNMGGKAGTFRALKSTMANVEQLHVVKVIGKALHEELIDQIKTESLTTENETLLTYIRPLVANRTAAQGFPELALSIEAFGVYSQLVEKNEKNTQVFAKPDSHRLNESRNRLMEVADDYSASLHAYLVENVADYELFAASAAYNEDNTTTGPIDDQEDNGMVGMF